MTVKAVPEGYRSVTPYLNVADASALLGFLKRAFGAAELINMRAADGSIQHAEVRIGDSIVMLSDALRDSPMPSTLYLYVDDTDATFRRALAAGATAVTEPADAFWGDRFARVRDACGNVWNIATHVEDVAPGELAKRAAASPTAGK